MIVWIAILVLFIATIVAAYFGARTWHWAHVTLVVFLFLATVGFMVLAAETLRINAILRQNVNQLQEQVAQVDARNDALEHGSDDPQIISQLAADEIRVSEEAETMPSLGDLDHRLHLETRRRGRAWEKVALSGFHPETGTLQVTIESPQPPGIAADAILYLFESGPPVPAEGARGSQYLGEFRVGKVNGQQVAMIAVNQLDDFERQRLSTSRGPWELYETMPLDRHDLFGGLTEEQLRKWLPERSIQEYIRQGTPAGPDDDEWHRIGYDEAGNPLPPDKMSEAAKVLYERRLRDYSVEFDKLAEQRVILLTDISGVLKDNERLVAALDSARKLQAFREDEIAKLSSDLAGVKKELQIIEGHLAMVQTQLANSRKLLDEALAHNEQLARRLATLQAQAAERDRSSAAPDNGPLALSP